VTVPELLENATTAARQAGVEEIFVYGEAAGATRFESLRQAGGESPHVAIDPANDLVALPYSSGTNGPAEGRDAHAPKPRGEHLPRHLRAPPEQWADDRVIAVLPFFHSYGLVWLLNLPVCCGATVVTIPRFDLREFLRVIQDYRITFASVVPPIVLALVKHPPVDEFDLSSLDVVGCGAAPLSAELEAACGKRLGCRLAQGYGLTETTSATHRVNFDLAGQMPGELGPLNPNTECRIVDVLTGEDTPAGEPGELLIRGPQVIKGYLHNPQATALTIDPDGWLHTGDVAPIQDSGSLRIIDRIKELIKYKGHPIAPAELEALLLTHPATTDAAVIPRPDDGAGEVPKAFVVTTGRSRLTR
jgi:acyl-CoA synthetase (AMP-forming)/AMP-acid ligase II